MAHAKFQSPSINIDIYFQLSFGERKGEGEKGRKEGRKKGREKESKWRYHEVELRIFPKGKGGAKNCQVLLLGQASDF